MHVLVFRFLSCVARRKWRPGYGTFAAPFLGEFGESRGTLASHRQLASACWRAPFFFVLRWRAPSGDGSATAVVNFCAGWSNWSRFPRDFTPGLVTPISFGCRDTVSTYTNAGRACQ